MPKRMPVNGCLSLLSACFGLLACLSWLAAPVNAAPAGEIPPKPIMPLSTSLGRKVLFEKDIAPFLEANCTACHNSAIDEGRLSLETRTAMLKGGRSGPAVVPGQPEASLLFSLASHRQRPVMPPVGNDVEARNLTPAELGILRQWIVEGANIEPAAALPGFAWKSLPAGLTAVHSVALSPHAEWAAAGRSNQVWIYSLTTGESQRLVDDRLQPLTIDGKALYPHGAAHRDLVQALAFSPDGQRLATGGYRVIKIWKQTGLGATVAKAACEAQGPIARSSDGRFIAVADGHRALLFRSHSPTAGTATASDEPTAQATTTAEKPIVAIACEIAESGELPIIWFATENELFRWQAGRGESQSIASLPPGAHQILLTAQRHLLVGNTHQLEIRDRRWPAEIVKTIQFSTNHPLLLAEIPGRNEQCVVAEAAGEIRILELPTAKVLRKFSHGGAVTCLTVDPASQSIVTGGAEGTLRWWDSKTGEQTVERTGIAARQQAVVQLEQQLEWRRQIAAVANNKLIEQQSAFDDRQRLVAESRTAIGSAQTLLARLNSELNLLQKSANSEKFERAALDALTKQITEAERSLESAQRSVTFAEESVAKVKSKLDSQINVQQAAETTVSTIERELAAAVAAAEQELVPVKSVCFNQSGNHYCVLFQNGALQLHDAVTGDGRSIPQTASLTNILSLVEERVLVRKENGEANWIDCAAHWEFEMALGPPADQPLDPGNSPISHRVLALAFSPDGKSLASAGGEPSRSGEVLVWNLQDRTIKLSLPEAHSDTVQSVTFSRDGQWLATSGSDKFAKLFNAETGEHQHSFEGHTDHVLGVAIRADASELATASADKTVKLWDLATGEQKRTIAAHDKQVTGITFVGLSDQIATSGGDARARTHRTTNGSLIRNFEDPRDYLHAVATNDDGSRILAGGEEGTVFLWETAGGRLLRRFSLEPLTTEETLP